MQARKNRLFAFLLLLGCFIFVANFFEPSGVAQAKGHLAQSKAVLSFSVLPPEEGQAKVPRSSGTLRKNGSDSPPAAVGSPREPSPAALDLASHWVTTELTALMGRMDLDMVLSEPLLLDKPLTRDEFVHLLGQLFASLQSEAPGTVRGTDAGAAERHSPFLDVPPEAPYAPYLADFQQLGLFTGTGQGRFSPEKLLTRLELMAVAGRAVRLGRENFEPNLRESAASILAAFKDEALVPTWARADVELAAAAGVIRGRPGAVLAPHVPATRAEALAVLARLLPRLAHYKATSPAF